MAELSEDDRKRISVRFDDDQFDAKRTVASYRKMNGEKPLDAFVVAGSPTALAAAPLTEGDGVPLVTIGASDPAIVAGRERTFIHWIDPVVEAQAIVDELEKRNAKKIAFVTWQSPGFVAVTDAIISEIKNRGLQARILEDVRLVEQEDGQRSLVTRLRNKGIDTLVPLLAPTATVSLFKVMSDQKYKPQVLSAEIFDDQALVDSSQGKFDGVWFVTASAADPSFAQRFLKATGAAPGWAACNAYDVIQLIIAAVKQESSLKQQPREAIKHYLQTLTNYRGACGEYSASGRNTFTLQVSPRVIRDGKIVPVQDTDRLSVQPRG